MPPIGDGPTQAWTAELQRSGRVEFPRRREPLLRSTRAAGLFVVLLAVSELPHAVRSGGVLRVVGIVITTVAVVSVGVDCWHLLTRRPVLTVDGSGVRLGRRRFVAWSEIESIAELDGPTSDHTFVVVPNVRKRRLRVGHDHVRNVPAFRFWLGDLLDEHRA